MPSRVVTIQYSPFLARFWVAGSSMRSILEPSPLAVNHVPWSLSHTNSVVMPPSERVAFSEPQHKSAVRWVALFDPAFLESWRQLA